MVFALSVSFNHVCAPVVDSEALFVVALTFAINNSNPFIFHYVSWSLRLRGLSDGGKRYWFRDLKVRSWATLTGIAILTKAKLHVIRKAVFLKRTGNKAGFHFANIIYTENAIVRGMREGSFDVKNYVVFSLFCTYRFPGPVVHELFRRQRAFINLINGALVAGAIKEPVLTLRIPTLSRPLTLSAVSAKRHKNS